MVLEAIGILFMVIMAATVINAIENNKRKRENKISFKEAMDLTELPIATFYNGNRKLNFLLDTGSNVSYINSSIISLLDHEKTGANKERFGIEGNLVNDESCKMTIHYKNQKFEGEFFISDLDKAFEIIKQESGVQMHGILGSKFFEKYKYILDFNELIAYMK